jgi:hypothetical protein
MELTNQSYLNSRNNYLSSLSSQKLSAERFASGKKNWIVLELMLALYHKNLTEGSNFSMIVHPLLI